MIKNQFLIFVIVFLFLNACNEKTTPKPDAYFRISLPEHEYQLYESEDCPFKFEFPVYSKIFDDNETQSEKCWKNIKFGRFNASIHVTFKPVDNNLDSLLEDSYTLIYKHTIKADAIEAKDYANDSLKVYATFYDITGNAASPMQFHITDSVNYFFRGSLYFNSVPNADSLAPVIVFLKEDVFHIIETFQWK